MICANNARRRHIRRWAREQQNDRHHHDRCGNRRRFLSARFRPKLHWGSKKANSPCRPGEANFSWRSGEANFPPAKANSRRRPGQASLTRCPGQQASGGRCHAITIEVPRALRGKRSALTGRVTQQADGEQTYQLQPDATGEDSLGEFGGRPAQGSAGTQQHELDGAEIRQPVTARDLGKARRDQVCRKNRDA
jgi:hypothetical protein